MKFLADGMLGKLTRWLRMLGQDVLYSVQFDDSELLELAKNEERVLLTKDFELYKRAISRGIDAYYVEGKTESERLAEVAKRYGLSLVIDMDKSHCPVCNTKLKQTPKEQLQNELEEKYVHLLRQILEMPKLRTNLLARRTLDTNQQYIKSSTSKTAKAKKKN